jgi:hypothetical protein
VRWTLLAVAGVLLALAGPAQAAGRLLHVNLPPSGPYDPGPVAGPALAGDDVMWARLVPGGYDVVTLPVDGSHATRYHVEKDWHRGTPWLPELDASRERWALAETHPPSCIEDGCPEAFVRDYASMVTGAIGGPPRRVPRCGAGSRCQTPCALGGASVSGQVVSVFRRGIAGGCDAVTVLRDYGAGTRPVTRSIAGCAPQIAGDLIAFVPASPESGCEQSTGIRVVNWRSGESLYSLPGIAYYSVQEDGRLATARLLPGPGSETSYRARIGWASPGEPSEHQLATDGTFLRPLIANDRVAYLPVRREHEANPIAVLGLDGRELARADGVLGTRFDFDGDRLAWFTRPCERAAIAVWDLRGPAPAMPAGPCPLPAPELHSIRVTRTGRLRLALRCPPKPALGCAGSIDVLAQRTRHPLHRTFLASGRYRFGPGRRRVKSLDLSPGLVCADRHGRTRAWLRLFAPGRGRRAGYGGPRSQHRFRLALPGVETSRC